MKAQEQAALRARFKQGQRNAGQVQACHTSAAVVFSCTGSSAVSVELLSSTPFCSWLALSSVPSTLLLLKRLGDGAGDNFAVFASRGPVTAAAPPGLKSAPAAGLKKLRIDIFFTFSSSHAARERSKRNARTRTQAWRISVP